VRHFSARKIVFPQSHAGILGLYRSVYHIFIIALYNGAKSFKSITKAFRSTLEYRP